MVLGGEHRLLTLCRAGHRPLCAELGTDHILIFRASTSGKFSESPPIRPQLLIMG